MNTTERCTELNYTMNQLIEILEVLIRNTGETERRTVNTGYDQSEHVVTKASCFMQYGWNDDFIERGNREPSGPDDGAPSPEMLRFTMADFEGGRGISLTREDIPGFGMSQLVYKNMNRKWEVKMKPNSFCGLFTKISELKIAIYRMIREGDWTGQYESVDDYMEQMNADPGDAENGPR